MRKKALLVLGILLLGLLVWLYLARNRLLDSAIETAGSAMVGARVELDGLNLDLAHLEARFNRLQVTNPRNTWKNLLEFGPSRFDVRAEPLIWNRFVVDEFSVTGIRIDSPRESDGALPGEPQAAGPSLFERAKRSFLDELERSPVFDLRRLASRRVNVDSVLAVLQIGVVDSVRMLKASLDREVASWHGRVSEMDPRQTLKEIQDLVQPIRPADIRTLQELTDALERVKAAQAKLRTLEKQLDPSLKEAKKTLVDLRQRFSLLDDWAREDLQRARRRLGLPNLEPAAVSQMLFGRAVVEKALGALYWVGLARRAVPVAEKARAFAAAGSVKKPPRGKGVNVVFPVKHAWPKWLVRRILISATSSRTDTTRRWDVTGEVTGLTSHPAVYGKPATLRLKGSVPGGARFDLSGVLDHRGNQPVDQFELNASRLRLGKIPLAHASVLPEAVVLGSSETQFSLDLEGEALTLHLTLVSPKAEFVLPRPGEDSPLVRVIQGVFTDLPALQLEVWIRGTIDRPHFAFRSNLDVVLSRKLKEAVGREVQRTRARVEAHVQKVADQQRAELERWYGKRVQPLLQQVEAYRAQIEEARRMLEEKRKALEGRIEDEKRKAKRQLEEKAKSKARSAVKNLLKGRHP